MFTNQNEIDFPQLIQKYKSDNYKRMKVINHQFLYSCFHPQNEDLVVCLEQNNYPSDVHIYNLKQTQNSDSHEDFSSEHDIHDDLQTSQSEDKSMGGLLDNRVELEESKIMETHQSNNFPLQKLLTMKGQRDERKTQKSPDKPLNGIFDNRLGEGILKKLVIQEKEEKKQAQNVTTGFEFSKSQHYCSSKEVSKGKQYKYAISLWKINKGGNPMQAKEYGFNGCPHDNKFYISQDGSLVYFFQQLRGVNKDNYEIRRVVILSIENLSVVRIFDLPPEFQETEIGDTALLSKGELLFINGVNTGFYFFSTINWRIRWSFGKIHSEQDKNNQTQLSSFVQSFQDLTNSMKTWEVLQILFLGDSSESIYPFVKTDNDEVKLYCVKFYTRFDDFFRESNLVFSKECATVGYDMRLVSNKGMQQFLLRDSSSLQIFSVDLQSKQTRYLRKIDFCQNFLIQKNPWLYEELWISACNQNGDSIVFGANDPVFQLELIDQVHETGDNPPFFDVRKTNHGEISIIGQPQLKPGIVINFFDKESEDPTISYIQEISEYKCLYPYVFYCKGNIELFIHCIYHPDKVYRYQLNKEAFVCFLDTGPQFEAGNLQIRENETISYLSQRDKGRIHMNVLQFNHFESPGRFNLLSSIQSISKKDSRFGSVVKACVMKAERKEMKGGSDYILVMQYRTQIVMKSFVSTFYHQIEKGSMIPVPMLYLTNDHYDEIYFLQKDGMSIKLQQIKFKKDQKDAITNYYDFKSNKIHLFTYHEGSFYIMDESLSIREFKIDQKAQRVKFLRTLEMTQDDKQDFATTEFETISLTDCVLYQGNQCYILHESNDNLKNHDLLSSFQIFECEIVQGPIKINGTKNLMFVASSCEKFNDEHVSETKKASRITSARTQRQSRQFRKSELTKIHEEYKRSTTTSKPITQVFQQDGPKNEEEEQLISEGDVQVEYCEDSADILAEDMANERKDRWTDIQNNQKLHKMIGSFASTKVKTDIAQEVSFSKQDTLEQEVVEVIFAPYIDDNEIWLTYHETATNSLPYLYPKVDFSTFVASNEENVLLEIANKFVMFTKSGKFLYNVDFQISKQSVERYNRKDYKLLNIDDKTEFFLFLNLKTNLLNIFKLKEKKKKKGEYKLKYFKDLPLISAIEGNDSYFDQPFIDSDGLVYQVQYNFDKYFGSLEQDLINMFVLFQDERHILPELPLKFPCVQEMKKRKQISYGRMEFTIVGEYLFLKLEQTLEYLKIFNNDDYLRTQARELNLRLDENAKIKRIMSTEKENLVQIVFEIVDKTQSNLYVMTWDLVKNVEFSLLEIQDMGIEKPENLICKGIKEKLNYILTQNNFYDLFYLAPLKFVKAEDNFQDLPLCRNERKVTSDLSAYLGMGFRNTIHMTHTLLDLVYGEKFTKLKIEDITTKDIKLEHFEPRYDSYTLFHEYALNQKVLQLILEETLRVMSELGKHKAKEILFAIIYPNKYGQSPFDIAIKHSSPKNIEIMLEMLILLQEYRLSQFIKKHMSVLFSMQLTSFERYLSSCFFKHKSMQETKTIEWLFDDEEVYIDFHTSYLGDEFFEKLLNNNTEDYYKQQTNEQISKATFSPSKSPRHSRKRPKRMFFLRLLLSRQIIKMKQTQVVNELDMYEESNNAISAKEDKFRRIEMSALEFDWIFEGDSATNFIKRLAYTDNDNLFAIPTIRVIIMFLWEKFYYKIRNKVFFPFVVYMFCYILYVTYIYEMRKLYYVFSYYIWDGIFIALTCLGVLFFMLLEIRQIILQRFQYFLSIWNNLDIISFGLNIAFVVCDLTDVEINKTRQLGAVSVWIMWVKLFYFLRLFNMTAPIVRMLMQILKDMSIFSLVFAIGIFGFGNTFYILSRIEFDQLKCTPEYLEEASVDEIEDCTPFTGGNFVYGIIHAFRTGLGDFQPDPYNKNPARALIYVVFLACAILIQVVLLNMLIAIMNDTFNKVTDIGEQSKLKEICALIAENEFVLNRKSEFKNSKYIIIAKLERAESEEQTLDGKLANFKAQFQNVVQDLRQDSRNQHESTKEELIANLRATEQKQANVQNRQNQTISQVTKDLKEISQAVLGIKESMKQMQEFLGVPQRQGPHGDVKKLNQLITDRSQTIVPE